MLGFFCGEHAEFDQVERADEPVADPEPAGPHDSITHRYGPTVLEQDQGGCSVAGDVLEHIPGTRVLENRVALLGALGAGECARFGTFFAGEAEADECADRGADFDGLLFSEVAEVFGRSAPGKSSADGASSAVVRWLVSLTKRRNSALVTGCSSIRNADTCSSWAGRSSKYCSSLPITKQPADTSAMFLGTPTTLGRWPSSQSPDPGGRGSRRRRGQPNRQGLRGNVTRAGTRGGTAGHRPGHAGGTRDTS